MYSDLNKKKFDFLIVGTALTESILASYLSKHCKKVLHLDINKYYGGDCKNFNFLEFDKHFRPNFEQRKELYFNDSELIDVELNFPENEKLREYNVDINPKFLYAKSMATTELSENKAANYLEFMSIKNSKVCFQNNFITVPTSKSEIFISNDLELEEKQKLLNFFLSIIKFKDKENEDMNATVDFKKSSEVDNNFFKFFLNNANNLSHINSEEFLLKHFNKKLYSIVKYVVGNFNFNDLNFVSTDNSESNRSLLHLINMIYKYLTSLEVYDSSPYLYPLYGSGEFSQALCRNASVFGAIYIINNKLKIFVKRNTITKLSPEYFVKIFDEEKEEEFNVEVDNIILNETFLFENHCDRFKYNDGSQTSNKILTDQLITTDQEGKFKIQWFYILKEEFSELQVH